MSNKKHSSSVADLAELAASILQSEPTPVMADLAAATNPQTNAVTVPKEPKEPLVQLSLSLRKSLRRQLSRLSVDADMTMRAFVLNALKEKGLSVRDDDLADLRKRNA